MKKLDITKILNWIGLGANILFLIYFLVQIKIYMDKVDSLEQDSSVNIELWMEQKEINGAIKEHMKK